MDESGSLVQPAGSAAFLSWGSSRAGMCLRESRNISKAKEKARNNKNESMPPFIVAEFKCLNTFFNQIPF